MENQFITSALPKNSIAFIFGSILTNSQPRDVDIIILYDPAYCSPSEAYDKHHEFKEALRNYFRLPIHITYLTFDEEKNAKLIDLSGATSLASYLQRVDEL